MKHAFFYADEFNAGCAMNTDEFHRLVEVIAAAQHDARAEAFLEAADEADKHGYVHQAAKAIRALATRARQ